MAVQRRVLWGGGRSGVTAASRDSSFEALTRLALDQERVLGRFNGFRHSLGRAD
jgi:hypothetical protein